MEPVNVHLQLKAIACSNREVLTCESKIIRICFSLRLLWIANGLLCHPIRTKPKPKRDWRSHVCFALFVSYRKSQNPYQSNISGQSQCTETNSQSRLNSSQIALQLLSYFSLSEKMAEFAEPITKGCNAKPKQKRLMWLALIWAQLHLTF